MEFKMDASQILLWHFLRIFFAYNFRKIVSFLEVSSEWILNLQLFITARNVAWLDLQLHTYWYKIQRTKKSYIKS